MTCLLPKPSPCDLFHEGVKFTEVIRETDELVKSPDLQIGDWELPVCGELLFVGGLNTERTILKSER